MASRSPERLGTGLAGRLGDLAHCFGNRLDPGRKRRIGLVGEAVVVLDVIDAALRKLARQRRELGRGQPLRLEGRAGERPRRRADAAPQRVQAVAGPAETRHQLGRKLDVMQGDIGVQGGIAEQHVEELAGIVPNGFAGQRDANLEQVAGLLCDGRDAADDLGADELVVDGRDRHLHALLGRYGSGAILHRARVAAHVIDRLQNGMHATSP